MLPPLPPPPLPHIIGGWSIEDGLKMSSSYKTNEKQQQQHQQCRCRRKKKKTITLNKATLSLGSAIIFIHECFEVFEWNGMAKRQSRNKTNKRNKQYESHFPFTDFRGILLMVDCLHCYCCCCCFHLIGSRARPMTNLLFCIDKNNPPAVIRSVLTFFTLLTRKRAAAFFAVVVVAVFLHRLHCTVC